MNTVKKESLKIKFIIIGILIIFILFLSLVNKSNAVGEDEDEKSAIMSIQQSVQTVHDIITEIGVNNVEVLTEINTMNVEPTLNIPTHENEISEQKEEKIESGVVDTKEETVWITTSGNYRTGPDNSYKSAGVLDKNTEVVKVGTCENGWIQISIDNDIYYIDGNLIYVENDDPAAHLEGGDKGIYQSYALSLFNDFGWDTTELEPLIKLWNRESNWNPLAENKSSGAYGIPQSLPASKMASEGDDYLTNYQTQIRWGLKYIKQRYGTPTNALAHSDRTGWY